MRGFELHLEYEEVPLPRERGFVLMNKFREMSLGGEDHMMALSRVRGSLGAMFFLDIVTADGKYIEQHTTEIGGSMAAVRSERIWSNRPMCLLGVVRRHLMGWRRFGG